MKVLSTRAGGFGSQCRPGAVRIVTVTIATEALQ